MFVQLFLHVQLQFIQLVDSFIELFGFLSITVGLFLLIVLSSATLFFPFFCWSILIIHFSELKLYVVGVDLLILHSTLFTFVTFLELLKSVSAMVSRFVG